MRLFRFLRWLDLKAWDYDWNRLSWQGKEEIGLVEAAAIILLDPIVYLLTRLVRTLNRIKITNKASSTDNLDRERLD